MPGPRSATLVTRRSPFTSLVTLIGIPGVGIFAGIFQQMHQDFADALNVHPHIRQMPRCNDHFHGMILERRLGILQGRLKRILNGVRLQIEFEHARIELRHLRGLAHQPVQAIRFFVDNRQQFAAPLLIKGRARHQSRNAGLDGSQRSAELVRDRIEQRGSQALVFLLRAILAERFKCAGTFDRKASEASQRIESFP